MLSCAWAASRCSSCREKGSLGVEVDSGRASAVRREVNNDADPKASRRAAFVLGRQTVKRVCYMRYRL